MFCLAAVDLLIPELMDQCVAVPCFLAFESSWLFFFKQCLDWSAASFQAVLLIGIDSFAASSGVAELLVAFGSSLPSQLHGCWQLVVAVCDLCRVPLFIFIGQYKSLTRYVGSAAYTDLLAVTVYWCCCWRGCGTDPDGMASISEAELSGAGYPYAESAWCLICVPSPTPGRCEPLASTCGMPETVTIIFEFPLLSFLT